MEANDSDANTQNTHSTTHQVQNKFDTQIQQVDVAQVTQLNK